MKIKGLTINESTFPLENGGFGKVAVFIYSGDRDPKPILEEAARLYVDDSDIPYSLLIDAHLNCPWMLTLISNINDMKQRDYNGETLGQIIRDDKLNELLGE
mgnify:CR=1 FL=1